MSATSLYAFADLNYWFVSGQSSGRVDARNLYYRVYAVVPFIGGDAATAPRRPKHAPLLASSAAARRSGILGWAMVESDDHQHALVELWE